MPYQYLMEPNLSDDFWTICLVENAGGGGRKLTPKKKKKKH
jgi:hypothetical protein